jgi:hypothetical protein
LADKACYGLLAKLGMRGWFVKKDSWVCVTKLWRKQLTHRIEGKSTIVRKYELFNMEDDEDVLDVDTMFSIFHKYWCQDFKFLIRVHTKKIPKWWPKVTVNQEANDLNKLPLEELLLSMYHIMILPKSCQTTFS